MGEGKPITMTTYDMLQVICDFYIIHSNVASRQGHHNVLDIVGNNRMGPVMQARVSYTSDHRFMWTSSAKVQGGKLLGNMHMAHVYLISGMLPNYMEKLCAEAKIGHVGDKIHEMSDP